MSDKLLTQQALCELLDISVSTAQRWRTERIGPPYFKVCGVIRYDRDDVEVWLAARRRGAAPEKAA